MTTNRAQGIANLITGIGVVLLILLGVAFVFAVAWAIVDTHFDELEAEIACAEGGWPDFKSVRGVFFCMKGDEIVPLEELE
jgi:hypothetical protein